MPEARKGDEGQQKLTSAEVINGHVASYTRNMVLPIMPVKLWNVEMTRYIETYALLNRGSTRKFCSEYLAWQLNATRRPCKLSFLAIEGRSKVKTSEIQLDVSGLSEESKVTLPTVYVSLCRHCQVFEPS